MSVLREDILDLFAEYLSIVNIWTGRRTKIADVSIAEESEETNDGVISDDSIRSYPESSDDRP